MPSDEAPPEPLKLTFTSGANAQIDETYRYLLQYGSDVAERWITGLMAMLERECELQVEGKVQRPLSSRYTGSNIVHFTRYTARKGAVWYVLFELVGTGDDETFDTLQVVEIENAARSGGNV